MDDNLDELELSLLSQPDEDDALNPEVASWDTGDVVKFFHSLGLREDYRKVIERHGIDGRVLRQIGRRGFGTGSEQMAALERMDVKVADALKVCDALEESVRSGAASGPGSPVAPDAAAASAPPSPGGSCSASFLRTSP